MYILSCTCFVFIYKKANINLSHNCVIYKIVQMTCIVEKNAIKAGVINIYT